MLKKLFEWTPRDIAYWGKIHQKGLFSFILRYGVVISASFLFVLFGLVTFFFWLKQVLGTHITSTSLVLLAMELIFVALLSIVTGVINSLITWLIEERLYRKYHRAMQ